MWIDPNVKRKGSIIKEHVKKYDKKEGIPIFSLFELSICGVCNRFCAFCPHSNRKIYPSKKEYISMELYKKILTELNEIEYNGIIAYSGFSEPLLHKELNKIISLTTEFCPQSRIELYTNGDFLNVKNLKEFFDAGLASIHISLYDGQAQIVEFTEMKKDARLKDEQVILRERYFTKEKGYGLTLSNRAGMIDFEKLDVKPLLHSLKHQCFYPFYMMMVDHNGDVLLCSHDWGKGFVAGNLNRDSILEVWSGKLMQQVREKLGNADRNFEPCNACDVKGTLIGGNHFHKWKEYYSGTKAD
jgi:radical SAM protein with 4Fe4S-binding SPASM domain